MTENQAPEVTDETGRELPDREGTYDELREEATKELEQTKEVERTKEVEQAKDVEQATEGEQDG